MKCDLARRRPAAVLLAVMAAFCVAAMIAARAYPFHGMVYPFTIGASTGFVATALAGGAHHHWYGRWMVAGLAACCVGDLIGPYDFVAGALAFLVAHFAFIGACLVRGIHWNRALPLAAPAVIAGLLLAVWLLPHVVGPEIVLVLSYLLVISCMVVAAWAVRGTHGTRFLAAGATLFYLSDIFLARWRYVSSDSFHAYLCYPLYYTACILLALSVAAVTIGGADDNRGNQQA